MPVRDRRRRYLGFTVEGLTGLDEKQIYNVLSDSVSRFFGVNGLSLSDLKLIEYNSGENRGIVRCSHRYIREVRACMSLIDNILGEPCCIHVNRVSGTIKSLRDKTKSQP